MCVLIIKQQGVKTPTKEILTACAKANPHGFGFVTPTKFFKSTDLGDFLNEAAKIDTNEPALIHCRYATHGSVKPSNCHPFMIGDWAFAHNGILYDIKPENDKTDSETAFKQLFYPLIKGKNEMPVNVSNFINSYVGSSKFAFLNVKSQKIYKFGNFTNKDRLLFSNTRWESYLPKKTPKFKIFAGYKNADFYNKVFADLDDEQLPF